VVSLCNTLQSRDFTSLSTLKDSYSKNVFFETVDDKTYLCKRPGLLDKYTTTFSNPQGLFSIGPNGHAIKVLNGQIRDAETNAYYGAAGGATNFCTFATVSGVGGEPR
jgi:hypothetical protein